jgi:hypothetical protein
VSILSSTCPWFPYIFVYIDAIAELIYADVAPDDYICISIALNS